MTNDEAMAYAERTADAMGAFIAYEERTQSSQWDRGFDSTGRGYIATIKRTNGNPVQVGYTVLSSAIAHSQAAALAALGRKCASVYGQSV